ncbi:MAG: hypothetical protein O3C34_16505, partial [Proteobacteria bacterium]|nr:hypothetical protein [Pseudomonadota bacterium]
MKLNKRAVKNTGPESTLTYSVSVSSPNAAITAPERFDPTTWLKRPSLELREFFPLMRGKSPSDSALPSKEQHLLHRALKAEIDAGTLPATRRKDDYAYLCSFIKCEDACHFAIAHQDDPA